MTLKDAQAYFSKALFNEVSSQIYLFNSSHILLFRRLTGPQAQLVSGPGGKINKHEEALASAQRELKEETGLQVERLNMRFNGQLFIHFQQEDFWLKAYIFSAKKWSGHQQASCEEGEAFWCPIQEIPWQSMWGDEKLWLPALLQGAYFQAYLIMQAQKLAQHFLLLQNEPFWACPS